MKILPAALSADKSPADWQKKAPPDDIGRGSQVRGENSRLIRALGRAR